MNLHLSFLEYGKAAEGNVKVRTVTPGILGDHHLSVINVEITKKISLFHRDHRESPLFLRRYAAILGEFYHVLGISLHTKYHIRKKRYSPRIAGIL